MMKILIALLSLSLFLAGCQPAGDPTPSPTLRISSTSTPVSETTPAETATPTEAVATPAETPAPYSHAPNYEWVSGRLEYADLEGGTWTLVYSEEPGDDPHGGKFVLQGAIPQGLEAGDLVVARGAVAERQMGINMAGTYYEFTSLAALND